MTPKQLLITVFICFTMLLHAQEAPTHLFGSVDINMPANQIKASYKLTNIKVNNPKMSFLLNEEYKVDQIYLNGSPIASSKNGRNCRDCKVYTIWIDRSITPQDTVTIELAGDFEDYAKNGSKIKDEGKIVMGPDFLSAAEASKWYPVIMDYDSKEAKHQQKQSYSYELKITSSLNGEITLGTSKPQKSGSIFKSDAATDHISLLAGNLERARAVSSDFKNGKLQVAEGNR